MSLETHIAQRLVTPRPDCQIWTGATDRGYGRISVDGRVRRVHRVVWEMENGPIPDGLTVDHLCRVRACCNTAHMELVTGAENSRRAAPYRPELIRLGAKRRRVERATLARGRSDTHCRNGHEYAPENTYIGPNGYRRCRTCKRATKARWRERQRDAA
jgi:hypothetical protein